MSEEVIYEIGATFRTDGCYAFIKRQSDGQILYQSGRFDDMDAALSNAKEEFDKRKAK